MRHIIIALALLTAGLHAQDYYKPFTVETPDLTASSIPASALQELFNKPVDGIPEIAVGKDIDLMFPNSKIELMSAAAEKVEAAKRSTQTEAAVLEQLAPRIKDYYITHDRKFLAQMDTGLWQKWLKAFDLYSAMPEKANYQIPDAKFIFEIRTPKSSAERENLFKELDHFARLGYKGVVTVWDGKENYRELAEIQYLLKRYGWKVWLSFSTHDYLSNSCYIDPDLYARGLKALARDADAFLLGWRRSSIHLFIPDDGWTRFTMNSLRAGNPDIGFIGEYYFGYNGTDPAGEWHSYVNAPANCNGVLVVNLGFLSVNPKAAHKQVRSKVPELPLINLIQGETAYYLSRNHTGRTKEVYQRINHLLEERFLNAGFDAVASMAGDGGNGMYDGKGIDNMCLSKNHQ